MTIGGIWGEGEGLGDIDVRVIRVTELRPNGGLDQSTAVMRSVSLKQFESRKLLDGDLLLEKSGGGPKTPVGRVALVKGSPQSTVCANFMQLMRPNREVVEPRYLHLFLIYLHQSGGTVAFQTATTNIRNIKMADYMATYIPLPPLDEQRRIVAILEDHLSRLDAAICSLDKAAALAETAMSAVRQQALVGGFRPLGEVAEVVGGIQKQPKRAPRSNPAPFLRVANVKSRGIDLAEVHEIELFEGEIAKYRLVEGDLLVVEGNGSASQIGRAATWHGEIAGCVHQNHLIRVRPGEGLNPAYLELVWNAPSIRRRLSAIASSTSGLHTLSVAKLKSMEIPVPDDQVQAEHVARFEEIRSQINRAEGVVSASVARSASLRRALLQAAFAGQLTKESSLV